MREVVTAQRLVYEGEADVVLAPAVGGQLGILPHHTPLLTLLEPGQLVARKNGEETYFAVSGGFMEVLGNAVTVFADSAERGDEIDLSRAEEARRRAQERMQHQVQVLEFARAEAALRRSLARIRVARAKGKRKTRYPKLPSSP